MSWLVEHWAGLLVAIQAAFALAIAIACLIPGEQPEKTLQKILDFLKQFSKK